MQLEKDLCRRSYKRERFVKTFCRNEDMKYVCFFMQAAIFS